MKRKGPYREHTKNKDKNELDHIWCKMATFLHKCKTFVETLHITSSLKKSTIIADVFRQIADDNY